MKNTYYNFDFDVSKNKKVYLIIYSNNKVWFLFKIQKFVSPH